MIRRHGVQGRYANNEKKGGWKENEKVEKDEKDNKKSLHLILTTAFILRNILHYKIRVSVQISACLLTYVQ